MPTPRRRRHATQQMTMDRTLDRMVSGTIFGSQHKRPGANAPEPVALFDNPPTYLAAELAPRSFCSHLAPRDESPLAERAAYTFGKVTHSRKIGSAVNYSEIVSPPARVALARQTNRSMSSFTVWIEPSTCVTFTPPEWKLREVMIAYVGLPPGQSLPSCQEL